MKMRTGLLAALAEHGQSSQSALGVAALLDRRDVSHTVRALEDRGLVIRRPDAADARQTLGNGGLFASVIGAAGGSPRRTSGP